jgi:gliding motility-associated-like protein
MKNFFTKAIYFIAVVILFVGVSLPALAQHTAAILESGNNASAIAKDGSGNIYVLRIKSGSGTIGNGATAEIVKYVGGIGPAINIASNIPDEDQAGDWATGMAVASNGDIYYITDNGGAVTNGNIMKLTYQGGNSYSAPGVFKAGTGTQGFYTALAMDGSDHLYAVQYDFNGDSNRNGIGSYTVIEFTSLASNSYTTLYQKLGEPGLDNAQNQASGVSYAVPTGLAINTGGDVFVSDGFSQGASINDGGKIIKLTKSTSYSASNISTGFSATALAVDAAGNLFASQATSTTVPATSYGLYEYANGTATQSPTPIYTPVHAGGTLYPFGIALINDNDIFITDGEDPATSFSSKVLQIFGVPATQASNVTFSSIGTTTATASWTNGNGTSRAVFINKTNTGNAVPVNSTSYAANVNYGSGTQIGGSGWYCVYNGTGTTVNITGLITGQTYRVMAVEYNGIQGGSDENYLQGAGTNNPNNVAILASETITFNALPTKTYGNADFAPGATSTNGSVTITYASDNTAVATIVSGNIHIVGQGTAHITASQVGDATHSAAADVIQLLTVNKAALTITANNQTKVYGAALPTLTAGYSGFVNSETSAVLTTQPTLNTTATAASHVAGSPYSITATGAAAANYTISYTAGSLSVTTAPLTVTANNQSKVYGAALPTLTASFTGLVNGDIGSSLTTQPTLTTTATAASHVAGSPFSITATGAVDADYTISYVAGTLTVGTAPLTITADNQTKVYGAALPTLTASYTGLVNGDTGGSLTTPPTLTTTATAASTVAGNPYSITASGAVDADYTISYVAGTLTVGAAPLTITANNQTKAYGAALPTLTASITGFVNGDTGSSLTTQPTLTTSATAASHVAGNPYSITASGAVDPNYSISYVAGSLTVTTAPLTVTANNQSKVYGAALPTLTASFTGLVNGDTGGSLTTQPTLTTTATAASHVAGSPFTITASGAVDADYTISYVAGSLTVGTAPLTITANNQTKVYGDALPTLTASYTGLVNGDTGSSLSTQPTLVTTATAASTVAGNPYSITASGAVDADYAISYVAGTLTVVATPLTITANNQTKAYGAALPTLTASFTGFVNGDTGASLTTQPTLNTTATAASHVAGSPYSIIAGGAVDPNYSISYVAGTLSVTTASLTITADNQSKAYGAAIPTLTASFTGFVNGDTGSSLSTQPTLTTTATAASHVAGSPYSITASGAVDADYSISYVAGSLTINATPLTILADDKIKVFGAPIPTLTASYGGLVNGDTPASLTTQPILNTAAIASSPINVYPITISGATDADYSITQLPGNLSIIAPTLSSVVNLNTLTLSAGTLTTAFSSSNTSYAAYVSNATGATTVTATADASTTLQVRINGGSYAPLSSGVASGSLTLIVGNNPIDILATAQDGTTIKTYTITVTRKAPVSNVVLTSLTPTPMISLYEVTGPDFKDYKGTAANSISSVRLTPRTADATNTITVNNVTVASGAASASIPLNVGDNIITTVVTSHDGLTSNTYSTTITRQALASLLTLTLTPNTSLIAASGPDFKDYTASVPFAVSSVRVNPTAADVTNTITVNNVTVASGAASAAIPLNVGDNIITTVVTTHDGLTSNTYSIKVTRGGPAVLATLTLTPKTSLIAASGPDFKDYTASVPFSVSSVMVNPTAADVTNTITVNNVTVASGAASAAIPLIVGDNIITTVVTTHDGLSSNTYSIKVTRGSAAVLASLTLSPKTSLYAASGTHFKDYTASVPFSVSSVMVIPISADPTNVITINNVEVPPGGVPASIASGTASPSIPLIVGDNFITTVVTSQDGLTSNSYSIKITRGAPAVLASLTLTPKTSLYAASGPDYKDYTASVPFSVSSVMVNPVSADPTNAITVNNVTVASGASSAAIPLNVGDNIITTVVTSQDGLTSNTYNIKVTRQAAAILATLSISPTTSVYAVPGPDFKDYKGTVANSVSAVTVTPTAADPTNTITINTASVVSGTPSASIPLSVGDNIITMVVTTQDGVTSNTYSIKLTREAPVGLVSLYDDKQALPVAVNEVVVHQNVSPNGDGKSDYLLIDGITAYPNNTLQIMNRNGTLVYETKGYDNISKVFDGHSNTNGKLQQAGTYFYSLEYKDGANTKRKTGYLVLKY